MTKRTEYKLRQRYVGHIVDYVEAILEVYPIHSTSLVIEADPHGGTLITVITTDPSLS